MSLQPFFFFSMCMFRLVTLIQNANEVEKVKSTIENLREALQNAKQKQKEAQEECKKLERDMDEFKNNKDGKIEELKVCANVPSDFSHLLFGPSVNSSMICVPFQGSITAQKSALQKHAVHVKTQQKELQTSTLELGTFVP